MNSRAQMEKQISERIKDRKDGQSYNRVWAGQGVELRDRWVT